MALITITEASRLTGKSTPTLYRHISQGKLSKTSDNLLDTSELMRVYGQLRINDNSQPLSNENHDYQSEVLKVKLELLEIQLQREREYNLDLRNRLDSSEAERRQLTQLTLSHQPPQPPEQPTESLLLRKLFKGKPPITK